MLTLHARSALVERAKNLLHPGGPPAKLLRVIDRRGRAIVPDLLQPSLCAHIVADAERVYEHITGDRRPEKGPNTLHLSDVAAQPNPHFRTFVVNVIAKFTETIGFRIYQRVFGPRVCFPLQLCVLRYQTPTHEAARLPWHQDIPPSRTRCGMLTTWITLHPTGGNAPGIEILDTRIRRFRQDVYDAGHYHIADPTLDLATSRARLDRLIEQRLGRATTRPVLAAGGAVLFHHCTLHRTWFDPAMTQPQMSLEIRGCNPTTFDRVWGHGDRIIAEPAGERLRLVLTTRGLEIDAAGHTYASMPAA
jgi:hypothetical protein